MSYMFWMNERYDVKFRCEIMKDSENSQNPTLILNQYNSDKFFDFNYSDDLKEVLRVLNKGKDVGIVHSDKLIELPNRGRLIAVSDLHGNLKDYNAYLDLWDENDPDFHIVFMGDLIHAMDFEDNSIEILDDVIEKSKKYPNFHCILGNHEHSHIINKNISKNGKYLIEDFENLIAYKKGHIEPHITEYINFFKTMPYFVKTDNGIFISHAGPSRNIHSIEDFNNIFKNDYFDETLENFLWNRYNGNRKHSLLSSSGDYGSEDIDNFLDCLGLNVMVVGHTPINKEGFKIIGRQMILSSSFYTDNKKYLDIDLSKRIESMNDLKGFLKEL